MLVAGQEQEAINYIQTYKPSNVFAFRRGEKNLFHFGIEFGLLDFVSFLMKDHKVLSCIARASRNVSHSVVVNGPDGDSTWAFKTASGDDMLFQFLWNNYCKLLSKEDLVVLLNFCIDNNKNGALTLLINSPLFLEKIRHFGLNARVHVLDILKNFGESDEGIINESALNFANAHAHLREHELTVEEIAEIRGLIDLVPQKKGDEKKELIKKIQGLVTPFILGKPIDALNTDAIEEGISIRYQQLNFFLYAAFTDVQLFKQLWENPQLEGSLYLKEEVEFKGHKFNNWLLVIVLLQKNTELLKVFLQKQNAIFSTRDFHSFVNFCLQDHHAYQHQLKNLLTLYPTPSIFQQLSN